MPKWLCAQKYIRLESLLINDHLLSPKALKIESTWVWSCLNSYRPNHILLKYSFLVSDFSKKLVSKEACCILVSCVKKVMRKSYECGGISFRAFEPKFSTKFKCFLLCFFLIFWNGGSIGCNKIPWHGLTYKLWALINHFKGMWVRSANGWLLMWNEASIVWFFCHTILISKTNS